MEKKKRRMVILNKHIASQKRHVIILNKTIIFGLKKTSQFQNSHYRNAPTDPVGSTEYTSETAASEDADYTRN
jgi:hypothetical protein